MPASSRPRVDKATSVLAGGAFVLGLAGFIPVLGLLPALGAIGLGGAALALRTRERGLAAFGVRFGAIALLTVQLLGSTVLPATLGSLSERANMARCAANLHGIGKGMMIYQADNMDRYPMLPDGSRDKPINYTEDLRCAGECSAEALGTGAQQNLCLLVRGGVVPWNIFLCPSTDAREKPDRAGGGRFGLGEVVGGERKSYIDYAIQIPYRTTHEGRNQCPLVSPEELRNPVETAIMADQGPAVDPIGQWSPNHEDCENVQYADGHIALARNTFAVGGIESKNAAGWGKNNIYTADHWGGTTGKPELTGFGSSTVTPTDPLAVNDSVLYAWAPPMPPAASGAGSSASSNWWIYLLVGLGVLLIALAVVVVLLVLRKKSKPAQVIILDEAPPTGPQ